MNKNIDIIFHWFFLPYRLLYILIYYILCKLFNVKNEEFHIYYNKTKKIVLTGWLKFYDPDKFWKQLIIINIEILMIISSIILHILVPTWFTAIFLLYSILYIIIRFDFKSSFKYLKNWKCNQIIKLYVGEELYYYAKWNYEDLTLIFPELAQLKKHGKKCINASNKSSIPLDMCKQIWSTTNKD